MYKISAYEYIYLFALDLGELLQDPGEDSGAQKCHDDLLDLRSQGAVDEEILKRLRENLDENRQNLKLGYFSDAEDEGEVLRKKIVKACQEGGKRIFTQHFLTHLAPTIFENEEPAQLFHSGEKARPAITPSNPFPLTANRSIRYKESKLRFFQNGVLGLELRFGYDGAGSGSGDLDAGDVIRDIRSLEEDYVREAAFKKMEAVFRSLSDSRIAEFSWRGHWFAFDHFLRLGARHRIILLKSFRDGRGEEFSLEVDLRRRGDVRRNVLREITGILNRAEWYEKYWSEYLNEIAQKFIAYQMDEIFVTDGNSSLIYFPGYWTTSVNKTQYIENVVAATHYLLSWESLRGYFDSYITQVSSGVVGLVSGDSGEYSRDDIRAKYIYITRFRQVVGLFRDALSVGSLVNHGFTARVLEQFLEERALRQGIDEMSIKLERFAQSLEFATSFSRLEAEAKRSEKEGKRVFLLQKWQVWVALAALILTAFFSVLQFFGVNWGSTRGPKQVAAATKKSVEPPSVKKDRVDANVERRPEPLQ